MRLPAVGMVLAAVVPWALAAWGGGDQQLLGDCPTQLSEDYLESEEGQQYLRDLEKLTGSTDPSDWSGDAYTTYFTVTCDD